MIRLAIATALAAAIAVPAYAQSTVTEYYVVQDTSTKKCTIVDKKPTTTTMLQVGPVAFKTRAEAESGMKTVKVCETR
jgi:long-subunit acyl-CoA synthetase (AMP-forming)